MRRLFLLIVACSGLPACKNHREPPGARPEPTAHATVVNAGPGDDSPLPDDPAEAGAGPAGTAVLGTVNDNLPFKPDGTKLASIAWRTWIYTDTGPKRTRFGYLRAGAVVDARGPAIKNAGCAGGWYRINPRGFVCLGKGATLDLDNPVVKECSVRPVRGQSLPYLYARAADVPPFRYFKLPSKAEMKHVEGDIDTHVAAFRQSIHTNGIADLLGEPGAPPDFLLGGKPVEKPYGVPKHLHYAVHAGRAAPDSGFAITRTFEWQGRLFGLTTELDIIALDRTRIVEPSEFHGTEIAEDEGLPVAFIMSHYANRYVLDEATHAIKPKGSLAFREPVKLTGATRPGGFYETRDGDYIQAAGVRILEQRDSWPSFATGTRKWLDISIRQQTLVAYVGRHPVYATLVSTGRGGMGDPEKVFATVRGTFMIHSKHVAATMDGAEDKSDSYNLLDVPFVQYFHKGYALHGTYWHNDFGKVRSHGCVNLAPIDSAWLFEWTDPVVPQGWHGALNFKRGTVVYIHG